MPFHKWFLYLICLFSSKTPPQLNAQQRYVEFQSLTAEQSKLINKDLIFDRRLYRQLMLQSEVGPNALPLDVLDRVSSCKYYNVLRV